MVNLDNSESICGVVMSQIGKRLGTWFASRLIRMGYAPGRIIDCCVVVPALILLAVACFFFGVDGVRDG